MNYEDEPPPTQYGTFQPQPVLPPGSHYYPRYSFTGYAVAEGRPVPLHRLPCCGLRFGWFLFIVGIFLGTLPWYIGAIILMCLRTGDYREKPRYIACTIAVMLLLKEDQCHFIVFHAVVLGYGWFLFMVGFFLGTLPWYIGAIILMCPRTGDYREKPRYIACTIAAVLATLAIMFSVSSQADLLIS